MPAPEPLADFDPSVARAVTAVLRRAGIPAVVVGDEGAEEVDEVTVVVPSDRRDEALATLAGSMEAIQAERARAGGAPPAAHAPAAADDEDDEGPPLVFERLRSLGLLPVLLIPLLIVTLAQVNLPVGYTVALIVGGMAALLAWRDGRRRRDDDQ